MRCRREAEGRRQAGFDALPVVASVVAAVHAAMVLLVEPVRDSRRHHQAVHALAELRIVLALGQEIGPRAAVARLPALAAVGAVEHAGRGDADPDLPAVLGMEEQRVQDEPGAAGVPLRPRRVLLQPFDMPPRLAARRRSGTGRRAARRHRARRSSARGSRRSSSALRRLDRRGRRSNASSSCPGRSTSTRPGRTTHCRRPRRSSRCRRSAITWFIGQCLAERAFAASRNCAGCRFWR